MKKVELILISMKDFLFRWQIQNLWKIMSFKKINFKQFNCIIEQIWAPPSEGHILSIPLKIDLPEIFQVGAKFLQ